MKACRMAQLPETYAESVVGRVRQRNEDTFLVLPEQLLFAVADGMGGHHRGDVASRVCVDALRDWFTGHVSDEAMNPLVRRVREVFGLRTRGEADLLAAVEFANRMIWDMASESEAMSGMGTTLVAAYFHGSTLFVVYSGDSRVYRLREGRLKQLSVDHSLLNEYLRLEMIRPSEARSFPYRNVILKAIGLSERASMDFFKRRVRRGDLYLLCSDGLTEMVEDEAISRILVGPGSLEDRGHRLVEAALEAGGHDNITVVLVRPVP